MSKIIWQSMLLPDLNVPGARLCDESYQDHIENTRAYGVPSAEMVIPDPKAFRSMSRAALFMANLCGEAATALAPYLAASPFSVGVYCACENGPIDAPSTAKIIAQNLPDQFASLYRRFRNPKMYLKQLPNLVPAQTGIFMGLQGPMNVYTHSRAGAYHALDQAEWDLHRGVVDAALVCATHAFDDYIVLKRSRAQDDRCLNEGAAAVLLVGNGPRSAWLEPENPDRQNFFGIADPLINILKNQRTKENT